MVSQDKISSRLKKLGLEVSKPIHSILEKLSCIHSDLFLSIIRENKEVSKAELIILKPASKFLTLHKRREGDTRKTFHVINNTRKRMEQVISSVFMRTIFRILKSSLSNLSKVEVSSKDMVNYDYHLTLIENLLEQMFYFSSKASGPLRLVQESVNIYGLLKKITDRIAELGIVSKDRLLLKVPEDFPFFNIDPERIEDVLFTLISNAVRYSPPDKPVEIGADIREGEVEIYVADHGRGIDDEKLSRIFDKYYHIDRMINGNREADNFSIGLHHLKYIVESHGGTIKVSSTVGKGSRFSLVFDHDILSENIFRVECEPEKIHMVEKDCRIEVVFPASTVYLSHVSEITDSFLLKNDISIEDLYSINLVVSESLANAIMHGSTDETSSVQLIMETDRDGITIGIKDQGGKFFYPTFFEKFACSRGLEAGGRGIFFLTHFMDEILYVISPGISTWLVLYKKIPLSKA